MKLDEHEIALTGNSSQFEIRSGFAICCAVIVAVVLTLVWSMK